MIPLPLDATVADIEQWCSRGIIMVDEGGGRVTPAWYTTTNPRRTVFASTFDGRAVEIPFSRVSVHWPRCGSVNLPGMHYAVHAERRAQRQYRRTWHVAGLHVTTPRAWDVAKFRGLVPAQLTVPYRPLGEACFAPEYYDYGQAERLLHSEERISVALSPRVIMAGDKSGKRMFYYNGVLAATAADGMLHPVGQAIPVRKISKLLEGRFYVSEHS